MLSFTLTKPILKLFQIEIQTKKKYKKKKVRGDLFVVLNWQ